MEFIVNILGSLAMLFALSVITASAILVVILFTMILVKRRRVLNNKSHR